MEAKKDIDINLWPATRWQQGDLDEIVTAFQPFGSVDGRRTSESRGLDLLTIIAFASGAVAAGFFNEVGSNLADLAGKLSGLLVRRLRSTFQDRGVERVFETHGRLSLYYDEAQIGLECSFVCWYAREQHLRAFFNGLLQAQSIVSACIAERRPPFNQEARFRVVTSADYTESPEPDWNLLVERVTSRPGEIMWQIEQFQACIQHKGKFQNPEFTAIGARG